MKGASVVISDASGKEIRRIAIPPGATSTQVSWDGKAENGRAITPGVLFYRLETNGQILKQKMIHLQ